MIEVGILVDTKVELIDGELLKKNAQSAGHVRLTAWIHRLLESVYGPEFYVQDHSPIQATEYDLPEPDLALVRGPLTKTAEQLVRGKDLVLVIEVSFTTVRDDRAKATTYALGGIPAYWLVNASEGCIEVYTGPQPDGTWLETKVYWPGQVLPWPERHDGIDAQELLPELRAARPGFLE